MSHMNMTCEEMPSALPVIIDALKDSDATIRRTAAAFIANLISSPSEAAPALIGLLKDTDVEVRRTAAQALRGMSTEAKTVVPALIEALKDKDTDVREAAAEALWCLGPVAKLAIPALVKLLKDENDAVRTEAVHALGRIDPATKSCRAAVREALKDEAWGARQSGRSNPLGRGRSRGEGIGCGPSGIAEGQNHEARANAAMVLQWLKPWPPDTIPRLVEALKDDNEMVRGYAAGTLGGDGREAKAAVPALTKMLCDSSYFARETAADALGKIGPADKTTVPALIDMLYDEFPRVRISVIGAWQHSAPTPRRPMPPLSDCSMTMMRTSGSLPPRHCSKPGGLKAKDAIPIFSAAMKSSDWAAQISAVNALTELGPEAKTAIPLLIDGLKAPQIRVECVSAIVSMGPEAKAAVPALTALLTEKYDQFGRLNAIAALGVIGPEAKSALPALTELLDGTERRRPHPRGRSDRENRRPERPSLHPVADEIAEGRKRFDAQRRRLGPG